MESNNHKNKQVQKDYSDSDDNCLKQEEHEQQHAQLGLSFFTDIFSYEGQYMCSDTMIPQPLTCEI